MQDAKEYLERSVPVPDPLGLPEQNFPLFGDAETDRQISALVQQFHLINLKRNNRAINISEFHALLLMDR